MLHQLHAVCFGHSLPCLEQRGVKDKQRHIRRYSQRFRMGGLELGVDVASIALGLMLDQPWSSGKLYAFLVPARY